MITLTQIGGQPNVNVHTYVGLSKDKKPDSMNGSTFFEMDKNRYFVFDGENKVWRKMFVDEGAKVSSQTALQANITAGRDVDLAESFALDPSQTARENRMVFEKSATVDFGDKEITVPSTLNTSGKNWSALYVEVGADVVLIGNEGGISISGETTEEVDGPYCITNFGGNLRIVSGNYKAHGTVVYGYEGTTIIEGGFFEAFPVKQNGNVRPWTLNLLNDAWKKGKAKFIVRGGTFVNFDPSHPNTDDASTYVEEGYKVIQEQKENGDIWYTVV